MKNTSVEAQDSELTEEKKENGFLEFFKGFFSVIFYFVCISIVVVSVGVFVLPRLFGGESPIVRSGSMEPTIETGDVVIVLPYPDDEKPTSGDIVAYQPEPFDKKKILHRVEGTISTVDGETLYRTQGDANDEPDVELVQEEQIVGYARWRIPYLGYPVNEVQNFFRKIVGGFRAL